MALICGNMRTNGILQYCSISEGGFNENGEPIAVGKQIWSEAIPCLIKTITNNSKGRYEDGKFNQASYEILIETANFPLSVKRVRVHRQWLFLGEFAVQGLPIPTTMDRVKIVV